MMMGSWVMVLQLGGVDGLGAAYKLCYAVLIN